MNFVLLLRLYLALNFALACAVAVLGLITAIGRRRGWWRAQEELRLHYWFLGLAVAAVAGVSAAPQANLFEPVAKVWSAPSFKTFDHESPRGARDSAFVSIEQSAPSAAGVSGAAWFLAALVALGSARFAFAVGRLLRDRRRLFPIRQLGRVAVFASDSACVAYSFWLPGLSAVVVPSALLSAGSAKLRLVIKHELQHHRQGDTRWVFAFALAGAACFANPFVHFWKRWISEIQEYACDEALVDRNVDSLAYARLLVESAETALARKNHPVCATGFTISSGRKQLHRRIKMMLNLSTSQARAPRRGLVAGVAIAASVLIASVAYASKGLVHDRRVSQAQAEEMAKIARLGSSFPIAVNDLVLRELNRYLGTPEGRERMRQGLSRLPSYQAMIEKKLAAFDEPRELLAVPLVESNYQNLPQDPNHKSWGAGLWMFIESTARDFGLRVDGTVDERLNTEIETDAAMRYLGALDLRFNNWLLALIAYNAGEQRVQKGIDALGTRDPWALVRAGYEGDKAYLARVMAAILIMKNPDVLQ